MRVDGLLPFDGVSVFTYVGPLDPVAAEARLAQDFDRGRFAPAEGRQQRGVFFPYIPDLAGG